VNKIKFGILSIMLSLCMLSSIAAVAETPLSPITGKVIKVVDGDTLKLLVGDVITNYRLAGVDTPETYNNRKAKKDIVKCGVSKKEMFEQGHAAKHFVEEMYPVGSRITFTIIDTGYYGRPIIWSRLLLTNLVRHGYARVLDYNNVKPAKLEMLRELEKKAISNSVGMWNTLECWR